MVEVSVERSEGKPADARWDRIYVPGQAYSVYVELGDQGGRDPLREAVLGLIRAGVHTPAELSLDLGVSSDESEDGFALVERVLDVLTEQGTVKNVAGVFQAATDVDKDIGEVSTHAAWMFWYDHEERFLPLILLDDRNSWYTVQLSEGQKQVRELLPAAHAPSDADVVRKAIAEAFHHAEFGLYRLGGKREIQKEETKEVRSVAYRGRYRPFPLLVPVEIRGRLDAGRKPVIIFYEPQARPSSIMVQHSQLEGEEDSDTIADPPLLSFATQRRLESSQPADLLRLNNSAREFNEQFIRSLGGEALLDSIGFAEIEAKARECVSNLFRECAWRYGFSSKDLEDRMFAAECNYLFYSKHREMIEDRGQGWSEYTRLLQFLCVPIANSARTVLRIPEVVEAIRALPVSWGKKRPKDYVADRTKELGLDYGGWRMAKHVGKPQSILDAINNDQQVYQLGSAFTLWLLPPLIQVAGLKEWEDQLEWIRASVRRCPNLIAMFATVCSERNYAKFHAAGNVLSLEGMRIAIYDLWRAIGQQD